MAQLRVGLGSCCVVVLCFVIGCYKIIAAGKLRDFLGVSVCKGFSDAMQKEVWFSFRGSHEFFNATY